MRSWGRPHVGKVLRLFQTVRVEKGGEEGGDDIGVLPHDLPTINSGRLASVRSEKIQEAPAKIEGFPGVPPPRATSDRSESAVVAPYSLPPGEPDELAAKDQSSVQESFATQGAVTDEEVLPPTLTSEQGSSVDLMQMVDLNHLELLFSETAEAAKRLDATVRALVCTLAWCVS